jgi:hypothetical protein
MEQVIHPLGAPDREAAHRTAQGFNLVLTLGNAQRKIRPESTSSPLRGRNSEKAQYADTPVLQHSARKESRTRTTTRTSTKRLTSGGRRTPLGCSGLIPPPHPTSGATFRAPFLSPDSGLKPWAVLYSRFAAKIRQSPSLGACPANGLTSEIILLLSA